MKKIYLIILAVWGASPALAQLYISPGATLHLAGNAQLTLNNTDLINHGNIPAPANGIVTFSGDATNSISGTQVPTFATLEIAKTGTGVLKLVTNVFVTNTVLFTSNLIELNSYNVDLGSSGKLEGENESSRITGSSGGEILFSTNLTSPMGANPGNLGAIITTSHDMGNTVIHRGHKSQTNATGGTSILRYYDIVPQYNAGLNATLRVNYFDAEKNALDENMFELWKTEDGMHWEDMGHSDRNSVANYVERTGLDHFSRWTLSPGGALPVTGMKLSGRWNDGTTQLQWITLTEYHNRQFFIERRYRDEQDFFVIGQKPSAHDNGNSELPTSYVWNDAADASRGPIEYRLRQQDADGRFAYSNVVLINPQASELFVVSIYPTLAVENRIYVKTGNKRVTHMMVSIVDTKGSVVLHKQFMYQSQWINLPQLNAGMYQVRIQSGELVWTGRFIKK